MNTPRPFPIIQQPIDPSPSTEHLTSLVSSTLKHPIQRLRSRERKRYVDDDAIVREDGGEIGNKMRGLAPSPTSSHTSFTFPPLVVSLPTSNSVLSSRPRPSTVSPSSSTETVVANIEDVQTSVDVVGVLMGSDDERNEYDTGEESCERFAKKSGFDGNEKTNMVTWDENIRMEGDEFDDSTGWVVEGDIMMMGVSHTIPYPAAVF
jgi:hypothetical protein